MLLCKVLRGRQEKLNDGGAMGSSQFEPSSDEFDRRTCDAHAAWSHESRVFFMR